MVAHRVIASVLLSREEERRLKRLARGHAPGAALLRLAQQDVEANGPAPAVIAPSVTRPVARKLSVAIPQPLIDGVDARRGTASYGAYLRSLLGVSRDVAEATPAGLRVICRAARPLPVGLLDTLAGGRGDDAEFVDLVSDLEELEERWSESYWEGISPGEVAWALLGLVEPRGSSVLSSREDGEAAFAGLRGLFRNGTSTARVVLRPSFVFRRHIRGRRIGQARWIECDEHEHDDVVVAVRVEAVAPAGR